MRPFAQAIGAQARDLCAFWGHLRGRRNASKRLKLRHHLACTGGYKATFTCKLALLTTLVALFTHIAPLFATMHLRFCSTNDSDPYANKLRMTVYSY